MRMVDLKQFSLALGELNYLLNLTLQGNFIDDEMIDWLVPGLITNHTLRNLDLSNNKITDKG
jgi:Leucine-rich repeat (LRR) protein